MTLRKTVGDHMARAIRQADHSYFFENYAKQADRALDAIRDAGFVIVRKQPSRDMLEAGVQALRYGRVNKYEVVAQVYDAMLRTSLKSVD